MWWRISACVLSSVCFLSACDKSDNSPPSPGAPTVTPVPKERVRPTTAQLTARTQLDLKYVPLSLMVPDGWGMKSYDVAGEPRVVLHGPTPNDADDVRFRVPTPRTITADQEALLETQATETLAKHPDLLGQSVLRDITGGKVIELLVLHELPPATEPIPGMSPSVAAEVQSTQPTKSVQWTFTVCMPSGKFFNAYDLSIDMTLDQYKSDNAFLRTILSTVQTSPDAPAK